MAHRLRGSPSNVSAEPLRGEGEQLGMLGKRGELAGVSDSLARLRHEHGRLTAYAAELAKLVAA